MTADGRPNRGSLRGRRVLLGVSGGIAAYKAAVVTRELRRAGAEVEVMLTPGALRFVGEATFAGLSGRPVVTEVFADPADISHVRMAREADAAVFAPATANLLGKFANGIADDLVSSTFTCLQCPVVLAPAMHTEMWQHPAVQQNAATLAQRGAVIVGPEEGELAGGDVGPGRLAEPEAIVAAVAGALDLAGPLAGTRVLVTAGGTQEPIDPVRYLGNRSSGKMGFALARVAAARGAVVDLVTAPTHLPTPPGVTRHDVRSAADMYEAVMRLGPSMDVIVKAAAVADFRPREYRNRKIKKDAGLPRIELERNPDILAELGAMTFPNGRPVLVGFAAETGDEEAAGREKLRRKRADLVVVNRVDRQDAGFGTDTNRAVLLDSGGGRTDVGLTSKEELAGAILHHAAALLAARGDGPAPDPVDQSGN